jgi:transposase
VLATAELLAPLEAENHRLRAEVQTLTQERRLLQLKVDELQRQIWDKKSERYVAAANGQTVLFEDPTPPAAPAAPAKPAPRTTSRQPRTPMGPKPLDPALPRETITLPAPDLQDLICPETKQPRQPAFVEQLEVLARKPAEYYVKRFERLVYVSPAKTAPVATPWPADVLPRARVHASVVAYLATTHFADHQPYYRIEQQLSRIGVDLPRNCQVSLMRQLDTLVEPLVKAMRQEVLGCGYVFLDATPIPLLDPTRPGVAREATLWAYRGHTGTVWFDYQTSKSPQHPDQVLREVNYRGLLQVDGATGLGSIGPPGQVITLGCHAHLRRYFFKAVQSGERQAEPYLHSINRLFRLERLAKYFRLTEEHRAQLRARHSVPRFDQMIQQAVQDTPTALPKSRWGAGLHYLLAQQAPLRRCLTEAQAELSNNPVENAIRPLKLGAKNWLQIGHPSAGPRLANLFTVVENCRQAGIDPEAYLIDVIARLPEYPAGRIADWLPRKWAQTRPAATMGAPASAADRSR